MREAPHPPILHPAVGEKSELQHVSSTVFVGAGVAPQLERRGWRALGIPSVSAGVTFLIDFSDRRSTAV